MNSLPNPCVRFAVRCQPLSRMRFGIELLQEDARGTAHAKRLRALTSYGSNLGICFQMVDDLLDFTADEKVLGKPVNNDLREGKLTLPVIYNPKPYADFLPTAP